MKTLILLKLGGSVITDKSQPYTPRINILNQLAHQICTIHSDSNHDLQLILGHGAGSFAHTSAAQYQTKQGYNTNQGKYGFCYVHRDADKLNDLVIDTLLNYQLPVYTVQPSAIITSINHQLKTHNFNIIQHFLDQQIIPVVYGDTILDHQTNATIFSTDEIFFHLALFLRKQHPRLHIKVIHLTDVDGVYDHQHQTINIIKPSTLKQVLRVLKHPQHPDVTGGMIHKIEQSIKLTQHNIDTHIINGQTPQIIIKHLNDQPILSTQITSD